VFDIYRAIVTIIESFGAAAAPNTHIKTSDYQDRHLITHRSGHAAVQQLYLRPPLLSPKGSPLGTRSEFSGA